MGRSRVATAKTILREIRLLLAHHCENLPEAEVKTVASTLQSVGHAKTAEIQLPYFS